VRRARSEEKRASWRTPDHLVLSSSTTAPARNRTGARCFGYRGGGAPKHLGPVPATLLSPCLPGSALARHPDFEQLLAEAARKLACPVDSVRRDYWRHRAWRALAADAALAARFARLDAATVFLTGRFHGAPPWSAKERARWRLHVGERIKADCGLPEPLPLAVRWSGGAVAVEWVEVTSLVAAALADRGVPPACEAELAPVALPMLRRVIVAAA
jgi:hypothetical protein